MAAIITSKFRFLQAGAFRQSFDPGASTKIYLGVSKPTPWADELNPLAPADSTSFNNSDIAEWLAAKRINISDTTFCFPRVNWTSGTIYDMYDDAVDDLFATNFVVMNEGKIYKCLSRPTGTASTIPPTGTSTGYPTTLADGYKWKYMFTVPAANAARFMTNLWIPINLITSDPADGSNQWGVQSAAIAGTVDRAVVSSGGSGFGPSPTVTITGNGTGATASATVVSGTVESITITNPGSGYTWATISVAGGTGFSGRVVLAPQGGHGSNAQQELGGFYVMVNGILNYNESGKLTRFNDYRKIFLIQNPTLFSTSTIATDPVYNCTTNLVFSTSSGTFTRDELVTGGTSGATARVVEWDNAAKNLSLVDVKGTFTIGETVTGGSSAATANSLTTITQPELDPNQGNIIYKDYRRYVGRDPSQSENLIIVVAF